MATIALKAPCCGEWIRVAAQPSRVTKFEDQLKVQFDAQVVAHTCMEKKDD